MTLVPSVNASFRSASEVATANDGLFTGAITGTNGTFPANPFQGDFITGSHSKASWLFNASLALNGPDSKWQLSAECQNCFDKSFVQTYLAGYTYYNPPMTWLVKARINF
jgi:iron complex outermembrane receptor protein